MNTILVGYSDENGKTGRTILPESSLTTLEQHDLITKWRNEKSIPGGFKFVEWRLEGDVKMKAISLETDTDSKKSKHKK